MCSTIQELDKKNDKAHKLLFDSYKKLTKEVQDIKGTMATKADLAMLQPKITAASSISKLQKAAIVFVTSLLLGLGGLSTFFIGQTYSSTKAGTSAQIHLNVILDSINLRIKESNAVARNFNAKRIMDTLNAHWKAQNKFYSGEYLKQANWTKEVWRNEIHPNTKEIQKLKVEVRDHNLRISKLESIIK